MKLVQQRKYLEKLIEEQLTVLSDESEGTQTVSMNTINACSPDYIDMEEPEMSMAEIMHMLHMDDPNIFPDLDKRSNNDDKRQKPGDNTLGENHAGDDGIRQGDKDKGKNKGNLTSDDYNNGWPGQDQNIIDKTKEPKFPDDFKYPDGVDIDRIVDAIINDDEVGAINTIVEFARPSIRDEKGVDFTLNVKPGQEVNVDTIIATIHIDGKEKQVRSIFSKGRIATTPDGKDYKRLFKSAGCDRHIVIEKCELSGDFPEINTDVITQTQNKFKDEADLYQFLTDNLCDSVLPWILLRRYTSRPMSVGMLPPILRPNGREIFSDYISHVNDIREQYRHDLEDMANEDAVRACATRVSALKELGNRVIARRKRFALEIIEAYQKYKLSLPICEFDANYGDCSYLAYIGGNVEGYEKTTTYIGETEYNNYYVTLLSKVDMKSQNKYAEKYTKLLTDIIGRRIAFEGYNIEGIKNQFDDNFRRTLNPRMWRAFAQLQKAMSLVDGDVTLGDVSSWIYEHTTIKNHYTEMMVSQMANIYMFVIHFDIKNYQQSPLLSQISQRTKSIVVPLDPSTGQPLFDASKQGLLDLTKYENTVLEEFWKEIIAEYLGLDINDLIDEVKNISERVQVYAQWPPEKQIKIGKNTYHHYLFENTKRDGERQTNDDIEEENDTIPNEPTDVDAPDPGPGILPLNENDPLPDEISIHDYEYWVRYFGLATVISLPFLNCGLDFPPPVMFIPLPCIFICLGVVFIQPLDVIMVFGLSIRGMYIWPIILFVNPSNHPCNIMTPLVSMLKSIQSKISQKINTMVDAPVTSIANMFINMLENENRNLRKQNKQLEVVLDQINSRKTANQEEVKRRINKLTHPKKRQTLKIIATE